MSAVEQLQALEAGLEQGEIASNAERTRLGDALVQTSTRWAELRLADRTVQMSSLAPKLMARLPNRERLESRAKNLYGVGLELSLAESGENLEKLALRFAAADAAATYLEEAFADAWRELLHTTFAAPASLATVIGRFPSLTLQAQQMAAVASDGLTLDKARIPTSDEVESFDRLAAELADIDLDGDPGRASLVAFLRKVLDGVATLADVDPAMLEELAPEVLAQLKVRL